ncbi:hypothetical protein J6590_032528 [Homalodisca vitripennis]|nr:hypothetical protein J6590_032528 [Homalodisca vitripennis]
MCGLTVIEPSPHRHSAESRGGRGGTSAGNFSKACYATLGLAYFCLVAYTNNVTMFTEAEPNPNE